MERVRILQQRRRYLIQCAASIAAIFLIAPACTAQSKPATPAGQQAELPWAKELNKYPGLLPEIGQLLGKLLNNVQFPAARSESRLLRRLPASTMSYGAFPNYGDAAHQALEVFRQELQESSVLRDWWHHGELATDAPKVEDSLEKFYQLHQYLGEEIVVSGSMEGREPKFMVVAEVRKPGLKKFLEQLLDQHGGEGKAGVRILDRQGLATAKDKGLIKDLTLLVRPDFIVGSEDLATLRSFNAKLDREDREFASTPFGQRVAQEYEGGVTVLVAADLQRILSQAPDATKQSPAFQQSGFADVKYLIWEHKSVGAEAVSQAELSFTGPRRGPASWLAKPAPLGSLDFVSPNAIAAATIVLTNPAQIFEDIKELAGPSSNQFAAIAGGEKALNLSLKDDFLSLLGGELTMELDSITPPRPAWRAMLNVRDAAHLQRTLATLLAAAQVRTEQVDEGGITYHAVRIPSSPAPMEISYAFVEGYLIVGSSHDAVAESARLHGSGGSLAKSKKLLESRPPGHSLNASALFYEDPIAMAGLQLQRFAPEMAESLAQSSSQVKPAVVCLYGEESAIREASSSGAFDVGGILVVAAIAIPNLLRSRIAANEASAVGSVRTVNTAQVTYSATYPQRGFAPNLATLGPDPHSPAAYSAEHAELLDETLANKSCTGDAWCTKSGFHFRVAAICKQLVCKDYVVVAIPVDSNTGTKSFCSTSDGVIRLKTDPPFSPVSVAECKTWPPLQ